MAVLQELYRQMPSDVYIAKSTITGYGEHLIKHALKVDIGEAETMAHYKAAAARVDYFQTGVEHKAMTVKDGALLHSMKVKPDAARSLRPLPNL